MGACSSSTKIEGGQLHGGGAWMVAQGWALAQDDTIFPTESSSMWSLFTTTVAVRVDLHSLNTTPAECLQTPSTLKQPPQHSSHLQTSPLRHSSWTTAPAKFLLISHTISQTNSNTFSSSEFSSSNWRVADTSCPHNNANRSASFWSSHGVQFRWVPWKTADIPAVEILADMWCRHFVPHPHILDVRGRNHLDIASHYNDRRTLSLPRLSPVLSWAAGKCTCVCTDSQLPGTTVWKRLSHYKRRLSNYRIFYQAASIPDWTGSNSIVLSW